jgi:hypothetical protein
MSSQEIRVDVLALEAFPGRLAPRLPEAAAVLSTLLNTDGPELGHFHHARQIERRYDHLREEFVARLRRLLAALVIARAGTMEIAERFRDGIDFYQAQIKAIDDALTRGADPWRAAALRDAGLDATLLREVARYEARVRSPRPAGESPVVGGGSEGA